MFKSISFASLAKSSRYQHAAGLEFFQTNRAIDFEPGLNVIFGPNGCGKSTLLTMLADTMVCNQSGFSAVTEGAVRKILFGDKEHGKGRKGSSLEISVAHDGQPVMFFDSRHTPGLDGTHFDDEFMKMGLENMGLSKVSGGESAIHRLLPILKVLAGAEKFPSAIIEKVTQDRVNDVWREALITVKERLEPTIAPGQQSIILDEPDAHSSIMNQGMLWDRLEEAGERFQIIVATHSPFSLGRKAHYIDAVPGFMGQCHETMQRHFERLYGVGCANT